jgi:phosphate-selective porin OprO and OprP
MNGGLRKTSLYLLTGVGALGILASGASVANATDSVAQLEAQMRAMQEQMRDLQRQVQEAKAASASGTSSTGEPLDLKVKWKGAPELSSSDGKFKFKVRGRLMGDYNGIDQDFPITGEEDVSGVELRRARLGVEGVVFYDWKYKFEVDFAGDETAIKDAYVAYANWMPNWEKSEIIAGNFKTANSLEDMTSSRFITFMERAAFIEAFGIDRMIGAGIWAGNEHWSFQTGYFGTSSEDQGDFFDDVTAYSARATVAPINNDTTIVHLGANYRHRNAGTLRDTAAADLFRYRARGADLHLADRFVATPFIGEDDDMFVLEGAFVWRRFSVQGEYAQLETNVPAAIAPGVSPTYNGWYVEASVFLTDDMRNYEADEGAFGRVKPKNPFFGGSGGWGAWQLAGKYDVIDLSDGAQAINASTAPHAVTCTLCGEQETWLIGLNWWMTDYTALKFNVTQSEISGPGENNGATISGFGMRAQIDW